VKKRDNCVFIIIHHNTEEQIEEHLLIKFSDSGRVSPTPSFREPYKTLEEKTPDIFPYSYKSCGYLGNEDLEIT